MTLLEWKTLFRQFFSINIFLLSTIKRSEQLFAFDVESRMGFTVSFTASLMTIELGNLGWLLTYRKSFEFLFQTETRIFIKNVWISREKVQLHCFVNWSRLQVQIIVHGTALWNWKSFFFALSYFWELPWPVQRNQSSSSHGGWFLISQHLHFSDCFLCFIPRIAF